MIESGLLKAESGFWRFRDFVWFSACESYIEIFISSQFPFPGTAGLWYQYAGFPAPDDRSIVTLFPNRCNAAWFKVQRHTSAPHSGGVPLLFLPGTVKKIRPGRFYIVNRPIQCYFTRRVYAVLKTDPPEAP